MRPARWRVHRQKFRRAESVAAGMAPDGISSGARPHRRPSCAGSARRPAELRRRRPGPADLPLRDTTFVVVDLETTGGRPGPGGPVDASPRSVPSRSAAGEVLASSPPWSTRPHHPPQIVRLTGITTAMVCKRPTIAAVLPMFRVRAGAGAGRPQRRDSGISVSRARRRAGATALAQPPVLCTVRLARRVLTARGPQRPARHTGPTRGFGDATPTHRALDDAPGHRRRPARADRNGSATRASTHTELRPIRVQRAAQPRKLAQRPAEQSGVYLFRGPMRRCSTSAPRPTCAAGPASTSTAPTRSRMGDGGAGHRGRPRRMRPRPRGRGPQLRLLAAHARRTTADRGFPHRWWWVVLTDRAIRASRRCAHPPRPRSHRPVPLAHRRRRHHELAWFLGVRTCTARIARDGVPGPGLSGARGVALPTPRACRPPTTPAARRAAELIDGAGRPALTAAVRRDADLAAGARYEGAARLRDQTSATVDGCGGPAAARLAAVEEWWRRRPTAQAALAAGSGAASANSPRQARRARRAASRRCRWVEALPAAAQVVLPSARTAGAARCCWRWPHRPLAGHPGVRIVSATNRNRRALPPDRPDALGLLGRHRPLRPAGRRALPGAGLRAAG